MVRARIPEAVTWHPARPGLECAYRVDPSGRHGPTPAQVAGRFWRSVGQGWYRPVEAPTTVEQRIVDSSYLVPAHGGVTGWAGLRWGGGRWFEGNYADGRPHDVPIAVIGAHRRPRDGVLQTKERFRPDDFILRDGLRTTTDVASTLFEMRHADSVRSAVRALDMACFNDLVSLAEVRLLIEASAGWTGIQQARDALVLADENAWSPAEVDFRLTWTVVGQLGPVSCNVPVFDLEGRHLFTGDVLDPVAGVVGQWQGAHHFEREARRRDIATETMLRDHGLELVEGLAGEALTAFLVRLRSAYARARRLPVADRRWTITPPAGWQPTLTVDQRRALSPTQRSRLLGHRSMRSAA